jgi:YesN/AraC family two-component response regulator
MDENQFKQALETILDDLKTKLKSNRGIQVFVENRDKFEGWVKVEIVDILYNKITKNIVPEVPDSNKNITSEKNKNYQHVDIVFNNDSALELKTINTNYRHDKVKNKIRPISYNIKQLKADIEKLRDLQDENIKNKAILFVVFPLPKKDVEKFENRYLKQLKELGINEQDILYKEFTTNSDVPNRIYYVIVRK